MKMVVIGVIGDFGVRSPDSTEVSKLVKSWNPVGIVTTGDNMYNHSPTERSYSYVVGSLYKEYLSSSKEKRKNREAKSNPMLTIRGPDHCRIAIATDMRFFPCVGNHDFEGSFKGYTSYFGLETYYGVEFLEPEHKNLVKFISLNNFIDADGNFESRSSIQRTWLETELTQSSGYKWIIVYFHYPQLCSNSDSSENERKKKFPFFKYPNVVLLMSGHQHIYERLKVHGITNVVIGTSGHSVRRKSRNPLPESKILDNSGFGALKLEINPNQIKGTYIVLNKDGSGQSVRDTFFIK